MTGLTGSPPSRGISPPAAGRHSEEAQAAIEFGAPLRI